MEHRIMYRNVRESKVTMQDGSFPNNHFDRFVVDKSREKEINLRRCGSDSAKGQNSIRFIRWKRAEKRTTIFIAGITLLGKA